MSQTRQRAAFDYLLQQFAASAGQSAAQRWRYLEAAHVLGQNRLALLGQLAGLMNQVADISRLSA